VKAILAATALLAGCALLQPPPRPAPPAFSAAAAANAVVIGKSTKADVLAALGEGVVVDFASGYEVWVYRERRQEKSAAPSAELVLLFEPSGILTKTRVR
jgi:outer membrane protein assembly factor BamE (lipoprotein component of BamABCDE complex)